MLVQRGRYRLGGLVFNGRGRYEFCIFDEYHGYATEITRIKHVVV